MLRIKADNGGRCPRLPALWRCPLREVNSRIGTGFHLFALFRPAGLAVKALKLSHGERTKGWLAFALGAKAEDDRRWNEWIFK
jgi:hypothetical protein